MLPHRIFARRKDSIDGSLRYEQNLTVGRLPLLF